MTRRKKKRTRKVRLLPWTIYSTTRHSHFFPLSSSNRPPWSFKSTRAWTGTGWRARRTSCSTASGTTWCPPRCPPPTPRATRRGRYTSATSPPVTRSTPRAHTWRRIKGPTRGRSPTSAPGAAVPGSLLGQTSWRGITGNTQDRNRSNATCARVSSAGRTTSPSTWRGTRGPEAQCNNWPMQHSQPRLTPQPISQFRLGLGLSRESRQVHSCPLVTRRTK